MATFRALLRAHVASGAALAQIAARLNGLLRDDCRPHGFVTCFLAELEPATGRLTYVTAVTFLRFSSGRASARRS